MAEGEQAKEKAKEEKKESKPRIILGYTLETADYVFIGAALLVLVMNFGLVSSLKQIPSPIYGGDFYNGLGGVNHILSGGSVFASAQMVGEIPWVPWLYHLCVAIFAAITGGDAMRALIDFSLPMTIVSAVICYFFVSRITGNKYFAVAGTILFLRVFPIFKYSDFAAYVMVPAFILMLFEFIKNQNVKNAAIVGVLFGLATLSNTQAFFVAFLVFFLAMAVFVLPRIYREGKVILDKETQEALKMYAIIFVIGFVISLLFWYSPIFVFHGNTPNPIQDITTPDATNPKYLWSTITDYSLTVFDGISLFRIFEQGIVEILFGFLELMGVAYLIMKRDSDENRFALVLLGAALICALHPLVTMPLFNKQLVNFMLVDQLRPLLYALLIPMGMFIIFMKVTKEKAQMILTWVLILLSLWLFLGAFNAKTANQYYVSGKSSLTTPYLELESWIKSNTNVNDVFMTTNEDAFMMNALTGRKVLSYRRAHSSPYTDVNTRMADQAVIVYGNDPAKAKELLKKYNVKYLLWTNRWLFNEFNFDQTTGQLTGFFDPLDIPDNASNRVYWTAYGVQFLNQTMSYDPAPRTGVPTYKVLIAVPSEADPEHPYSSYLDGDFTLVKTIQDQGIDVFRIYKIKD